MEEILTRLNQIEYKKIIWVLAITETLHNLEEAIWLPGWSQTAGAWHPSVRTFEFRFAVIVLTLLIYLVIYYFSVSDSKLSVSLLGGLVVIILGNVIMPHLLATLLRGQFAPGVFTGLILNVPATIYLMKRGIKEDIFNFRILVKSGLVLLVITIPLLQLLFFIGRIMASII